MGRTIKEFQLNTNPQQIISVIHDFLSSEGYKYLERKGENVYQKGDGLMMGPSFFKVTVSNNVLRLEAWMKTALLPGVYIGEIDLESFVGIAVKGPLKTRYQQIEGMLFQSGAYQIPTGSMMSVPAYQQPAVQPGYQPQQIPQGQYQPPQMQQNSQFASQNKAPGQDFEIEPYGEEKKTNSFCTGCGAALEPGAKFCAFCGTRVS